jgi:hypothetical protein
VVGVKRSFDHNEALQKKMADGDRVGGGRTIKVEGTESIRVFVLSVRQTKSVGGGGERSRTLKCLSCLSVGQTHDYTAY